MPRINSVIEAFGTPCADYQIPRGTPSSGALNTRGWGKLAIFDGYRRLSRKRCEIGPLLLWNVSRKSWVPIGASAIELAGARAPKFVTAGARAQQNLWGTCKKIKRLMKKPNIQQSVQRVIPWQQTHCHSSTALSITLCFMSAQTAVRHRFSSSTSCIAVW